MFKSKKKVSASVWHEITAEAQCHMSTGTIDVLNSRLNAFSISMHPTYITKLKMEHDIDWWMEKRVV